MASPARTVLHLTPHPDDELIGAPATLMLLRDAGYQILSLYCSFGSSDQARREQEAREACARSDFAFLRPQRPVGFSARDDLAAAKHGLFARYRSLRAARRLPLIGRETREAEQPPGSAETS
jgi:LmbE family N-acetylglucosaminyl deacetylase